MHAVSHNDAKQSKISVRGSPYLQIPDLDFQCRCCLSAMLVPTTEHDVSMMKASTSTKCKWSEPGRDLPRRCQIKPEEELALAAEQVLAALAPALQHLRRHPRDRTDPRPHPRTKHRGGEAIPRSHEASTQQHGRDRLVAH